MAQYTVLDQMTNKKVTFEWEGSKPPTEMDMRDVFSEARKSPQFKPTWGAPQVQKGSDIPQWAIEKPGLWGARGAGLKLYDVAVQPILEALGMVGGSLGSPVVGTALGYGAAKKTGEMGRGVLERIGMPEELQRPQRGVGKELMRSGIDVAEPLVMGAVFSKAAKMIQPLDDKITALVKHGIEKGIRPTVVGKATFGQTQQYAKKAESAVKSIIENKQNLKLTDPYGDPSPGLPKNLNQFSQAIEQTKRDVFKQYDTIAKQAGQKGAVVNLDTVIKELRSFANSNHIKLASPGSSKYALDLAERFSTQRAGISSETLGGTKIGMVSRKLTTEETQDLIAVLNDGLQAFYKNPSYHTAKRAYVDQMVANSLRKNLDNVILKATGENYQVLKTKYGSLKSIEKEVNHRAVVDARKNPKGLLDFSDVFTGYHAAKGILSLDPSTIGAAATGKSVAWLYRIKNNPNRIVKSMFKDVDKLMQKQGTEVFPSKIQNYTESETVEKAFRQRIPTGQKMSFEQKGITSMGNVGPRIPITNKNIEHVTGVIQSGVGAPKTVKSKLPNY